MTKGQDGKLEQVLQTFLNQLQGSIGGQVVELKEAVDKLNDKIDKFNVQLIDERIKNLDKDLSGYGSRLHQIENGDLKDFAAFKNKVLAYGTIALIVFPILVSAIMKYLF